MTMWPDAKTDPIPSTTDAAQVAPAGPPTREYRATATFVVSAGFIVVGLLFFGSLSGITRSSLGPLLALVIYVIEANGLNHRRPWARYAMTPMLVITVLFASLAVVVALSDGTWLIPIAGILAIWALMARASEALGTIPPSSAEGVLLVVGTFAASVAPLIGL
jgi:hypothetical protein